jgi:transcription elongation factor Elf1
MKIQKEEVEKAPTEKERGSLLQHFECSYCDHREIHSVKIAKLEMNGMLHSA